MKYHETCHECGHTSYAYAHKLNKPLCDALTQLCEWYDKNKKPCRVAKDLNLSHTQINNFQKLQYFGLIFKLNGGWLPSTRGFEFLTGKIAISDTVATMGGDIIPRSHDAWATHKQEPKKVYIYDVTDKRYKPREEYQAEKSNQLTL